MGISRLWTHAAISGVRECQVEPLNQTLGQIAVRLHGNIFINYTDCERRESRRQALSEAAALNEGKRYEME